MTVTPGTGTECTAADPARDRRKIALELYHFHLDAGGAVKAFLGSDHDCPDRRKQRVLDDLHRPRSM